MLVACFFLQAPQIESNSVFTSSFAFVLSKLEFSFTRHTYYTVNLLLLIYFNFIQFSYTINQYSNTTEYEYWYVFYFNLCVAVKTEHTRDVVVAMLVNKGFLDSSLCSLCYGTPTWPGHVTVILDL